MSGEPVNFYEDEAGTATVEDGSIAKLVPAGWREAIGAIRDGLIDTEPSAYDNAGYRAFASTVLDAVEDALTEFAGCAVIISHDRFFLDRLCTHMLAFEGDAHVEWFEGNFEDYEEDKKRRLGPDAVEPKRIKYKKFAR